MKMTPIGVIGSGTMGGGIAQVISQNGYAVVLYDISDQVLTRAVTRIHQQLDKLVEKGKLSAESALETQSRLTPTTRMEDVSSCGIVIEAVPEVMQLKQSIFEQLEANCPEDTILATNTSSFSVTAIAGMLRRPERVAGLHFFNPAPVMPLVEVVQGLRTSESVLSALRQLVNDIGKRPVTCQDTPGFIVNRVARPFYNEALRVRGDGVASAEQIDRIMKQAGKFKMGPFELQDFIGIDVNFSTTESLYKGTFGDPRFRPHFTQQRMVQSGQLGRKSGGGYYNYES